jgi:plasmid stabilization system protein ParE
VSLPATLTVEARDDLRAELRWIGPGSLPKAQALREAVSAAARRLGDRPKLGRRDLALLPAP